MIVENARLPHETHPMIAHDHILREPQISQVGECSGGTVAGNVGQRVYRSDTSRLRKLCLRRKLGVDSKELRESGGSVQRRSIDAVETGRNHDRILLW